MPHGQMVMTSESMAKEDSKGASIPGLWGAFDVICDTATLLVLEACWLGDRRFGQIQKSTGLQKALVSNRLKFLVQENILTQTPLPGSSWQQYILADKGLALFPAALMMLVWEKKWGTATRPHIRVEHTDCNAELRPQVCCGTCHQPVTLDDLSLKKGEAFSLGQRRFSKRRRQTAARKADTRLFHDIAGIVGDKWTALIIRFALMGARRFDDFLHLTGIASNILTDRLRYCVDSGLLTRSAYQDHPPRHEYLMTDKTRDLLPVVLMLMQWGQVWYAGGTADHAQLTHRCGADLIPVLRCESCGDSVRLDAVRLQVAAF